MHSSARGLLALLLVATIPAAAQPRPLLFPSVLAPAPAARAVRVAQAAPRTPELDRANSQLEAGDFEDAVKTLQAGLSQPDLTDDQLVEFYKLLGLAHLYLGNEDGAREAFTRLLQARPDYTLPQSTPPKVKRLYARLVEDIRRRRVRPVTIELESLPDLAGNEPVVVHARVEDLSLGARAKLYFRRAGAQTFSSVDFGRDKDQPAPSPDASRRAPGVAYTAVVPAYEVPSEPRPYEVEYYVEVADAAQRRLAGRGDAYSPLTFRVLGKAPALAAVARTEAEPWYTNPWVWVAGGAAVAGATVGIVLIATSHPTGTVTVTIRGKAP